ncbi:hypothetical protein PENSOL_c339G04984, partial [Penicillium solitum]
SHLHKQRIPHLKFPPRKQSDAVFKALYKSASRVSYGGYLLVQNYPLHLIAGPYRSHRPLWQLLAILLMRTGST